MQHSKKAASNFLTEVNEILVKIENNPKRYSKKFKSLREARRSVYPFCVIYEIDEDKKIIHVHTLFHLKRNPKLKHIIPKIK